MTKIESDQKSGLLITGAIWAWLATNFDKLQGSFAKVISILPFVIIGFFFYRCYCMWRTIHIAAMYTRNLEELFMVPKDYGWERYLYNRRSKKEPVDPFVINTLWFWISLSAVNLILGILFLYFWRR